MWAIILNSSILDFINDTGLSLVGFQTENLCQKSCCHRCGTTK